MAGSFWTLLAVFIVTWIVTTILAFMLSAAYGTINLIGYILLYALFMWNQACLETGGCKELAWLMALVWTILGALHIAFLSWSLSFKRKLQKAEHEASSRQGHRDSGDHRDRGKKEGFYWGGMSPPLP